MLFRDAQPEASVRQRFEPHVDAFAVERAGGMTSIRVLASAAHATDHLLALLDAMPEALRVSVRETATGAVLAASACRRDDVVAALRESAPAVARFGGIELTVASGDDELSLSADVELVIRARTDRWVYLLEGRGAEQHDVLPAPAWRMPAEAFPEAAERRAALGALAAQLGLTPA
jgi:hypothetical protein